MSAPPAQSSSASSSSPSSLTTLLKSTTPTIPLPTLLLGLFASIAGGSVLAYRLAQYQYARRSSRGLEESSSNGLEKRWQEMVMTAIRAQKRKRKEEALLEATDDNEEQKESVPTNTTSLDDTDADLILRPATLADVDAIAVQMSDAFNSFNSTVGLLPEFPSLPAAKEFVRIFINADDSLLAVSRATGDVLGSAFVDEADIAGGAVGCGPWTVKWGVTQRGVGRRMITEILASTIRRGAKSIRLVQIAANTTAASLYKSLGFVVREPLHMWYAPEKGLKADASKQAIAEGEALGYSVRLMQQSDLAACDALHTAALGISRKNGLQHAFDGKIDVMHVVCDRKGKVIGYSTGLSIISYTVCSCRIAWKQLLCYSIQAYVARFAAMTPEEKSKILEIEPPTIHTCSRLYPELDRWLISSGMRIVRAVNLMTLGDYQPIKDGEYVYSPSISF